MDAHQIERERFVEVIRQIESYLEATITSSLLQLQEVRSLLLRAEIAEQDGMRVRYFETEETVNFTSEPKGQLGFFTENKLGT
jgi:hypothetical protein